MVRAGMHISLISREFTSPSALMRSRHAGWMSQDEHFWRSDDAGVAEMPLTFAVGGAEPTSEQGATEAPRMGCGGGGVSTKHRNGQKPWA